MEELRRTLDRAGSMLSRLLDVPMEGLRQAGDVIRRQLGVFHVPWEYHAWIVTGAWVLALFILLRSVGGWVRLLVLLLAAALIAKGYGLLPPA